MAETFTMTREEYDALTPLEQGYTTYMRAEWPEATIPKLNPYLKGSWQAGEWDKGAFAAYIEVLDTED
jgi:hypothetical protein